MKRFIFLLALVAAITSCGSSRRLSRSEYTPWVGHSALEILQAMGNPDRIDSDGMDGSILRYIVKSDYEDPSFDLLDPDARPSEGGYVYFYLTPGGDCYKVESNREMSGPGYGDYEDGKVDWKDFWVETLLTATVLLLGIFL